MTNVADLSDPHWLPIDFDEGDDAFLLLQVEREALTEATFLDVRMGYRREQALKVPARDLPPLPARVPGWLFQTAFCGSTLLARTLHVPPATFALKEPFVLTALTRASLAPGALQDPALLARLRQTVALLARPWSDGGKVLVKPTNLVNRLLPLLLQAEPRARAVLLYAGLREFILSCCKKLPGAETGVRWMAQTLIRDTALARALGVHGDENFDFVTACVLTWYAQMEIYAEALSHDPLDRLRTLDMDVMMADPVATVRACAQWLSLPGVEAAAAARVAAEFARDAKRSARAFDLAQREREKSEVNDRYGKLVQQALAWAQQAVAPHARLPAAWKSLLP